MYRRSSMKRNKYDEAARLIRQAAGMLEGQETDENLRERGKATDENLRERGKATGKVSVVFIPDEARFSDYALDRIEDALYDIGVYTCVVPILMEVGWMLVFSTSSLSEREALEAIIDEWGEDSDIGEEAKELLDELNR